MSSDRHGQLPGAAVLNWEMGWDWSLGFLKAREDFHVIQQATGVVADST